MGLLLVTSLGGGCGAAAGAEGRASLVVQTVPGNARVYVDEVWVGTGRVLALRPLVLTPGPYDLTVTAPGYFPHDVRLRLPRGRTTVRVGLRAVPP